MQGVALAQLATGLSAATSIAGGIAGYQQAQGEKMRADINSYIGRTRAIQTDVAARRGLNSEMGQIRTVLGANAQKQNVGVMEMLDELRSVRDRDRRIEVGNRMSEASDWRIAGQNAKIAGRSALAGGIGKAVPSLFDLYELNR